MAKSSKKGSDKTADPEAGQKRRRNVVFVTLDDATENRLQEFIDRQRIKPDRAAVAYTALVEFLDREEKRGGAK